MLKFLDRQSDTIAEFLHMPGRFFDNFDDVRDEIIKQTKQLAGEGKVSFPFFVFIPWGPLPGGQGGGRPPPRFWRKIFQYIPPPPRFWRVL